MSSSTFKPRLIIHGGAGNITRKNLHPHAWEIYSAILLTIHRSTSALLSNGATALDAAVHAVTLFEDSPLFNCGKGKALFGFVPSCLRLFVDRETCCRSKIPVQLSRQALLLSMLSITSSADSELC